MKKKRIFVFFLTAVLLGLVHSCVQELIDEPFDEFKERLIDDAMRKYDSYFPEEGLMELRSWKDGANMAVMPLWGYANVYGDKDYHVAEFLLTSEKSFNFAMPDAAEKFKQTKDRRYMMSKTVFVYLVEKKTGVEDMFLMTVVPDLSYIEYTKFKPFDKMAYLKRDKKFSGMVFFHNLKGEYVNGWRYLEGNITHTVKAHSGEHDFNIVTTRSTTCYDFYLEYLVEVCVFWGNASGENWGWTCYSWNEYEYWFSECYSNGGGDGGYGGSGSGGGGGGSGNGGGNTPQVVYDGTDQNLIQLAASINAIMPQIDNHLLTAGIDLTKYKISVIDMCGVNAKYENGVIYLCNSFLNWSFYDQASIIWHEIYHLHNDSPWNSQFKSFSEPKYLVPTPWIENYIRNVILAGMSPSQKEYFYLQQITINGTYSPEYYQNEIAAYQAERKAMLYSSLYYQETLDYMIWEHQQNLNYANSHYYKNN